jgi:hypothetical protein
MLRQAGVMMMRRRRTMVVVATPHSALPFHGFLV